MQHRNCSLDWCCSTLKSMAWAVMELTLICWLASWPVSLLLTLGKEPPALNMLPRPRCLSFDWGGEAPALFTDRVSVWWFEPVGLAPTELLAEAALKFQANIFFLFSVWNQEGKKRKTKKQKVEDKNETLKI